MSDDQAAPEPEPSADAGGSPTSYGDTALTGPHATVIQAGTQYITTYVGSERVVSPGASPAPAPTDTTSPAKSKPPPHRRALVVLAALVLMAGAWFLIALPGGNAGHHGSGGPTTPTSSPSASSPTNSPDVSSIALVNPRSGYSVGRSETISGTITASGQGTSVWVIVTPAGGGRLVPQGPCNVDLSSTWVCPDVQIGGEADASHWYEIFAVAASADAAATLASGRATGLDAMPGGLPTSPKILVVRR